MTAVSDILNLITASKADLQTLYAQGQAALALVNGGLQAKLNQAKAFANALGNQFTATGADRVAALQAEIDATTATLDKETDPLNRMVIMRHLANLKEYAAAQGLNTALAEIVVFSPDEVTEINALLTQADHDIANRQDLASAIRILTTIVTTSAQIAGKVATAGL